MLFSRGLFLRGKRPSFFPPASIGKRTFTKIPISNPFAIRLHSMSRGVVRGIILFYTSALVIGGGGYAGFAYYVSQYQPIAREWPLEATFTARIGTWYQDITDDEIDPQLTVDRFTDSLRLIGESEGEVIDKTNEKESHGKFKLLPLGKLKEKSKEWQASYVDVVIRLALAKAEIGDLENARKLVMYSTGVAIDIGSVNLRSKSLRLVSKIIMLRNESPEQAENYLLDAVRYNEIHHDNIHFKENGSILLDPIASHVNRETFESLKDLGIFYSKIEEYSKSLEVFLNLLQIVDSENFKEISKYSDSPLLKNYISEILYKKGMISQSLKWCQDAYTEASFHAKTNRASAVVSQQALANSISLYKKLGNEEKAKELQVILDDIIIPQKDQSTWSQFKDLLFSF